MPNTWHCVHETLDGKIECPTAPRLAAQIAAVSERADAWVDIDFVAMRGGRHDFGAIASPPSEWSKDGAFCSGFGMLLLRSPCACNH